MSEPSGRVVAELGRPETPAETAERKARARTLRRSRQNFRNLIASLAVTVGLVAVIVLIVPRGGAVQQPAIDARSVAEQLTATAGRPLVAPELPAAWRSNAADLRGSGSSASWYVGYVVGGAGYAAITEGLPGDDELIRTTVDGAAPTGTTRVGGLPWRVYDRRDLGDDAGNVAYALTTRIEGTLVAVYGTAPTPRLRSLAAAVARDGAVKGLGTTGTLP